MLELEEAAASHFVVLNANCQHAVVTSRVSAEVAPLVFENLTICDERAQRMVFDAHLTVAREGQGLMELGALEARVRGCSRSMVYMRAVVRDALKMALRDWGVFFALVALAASVYRVPGLAMTVSRRVCGRARFTQAWFLMVLQRELYTVLRHIWLVLQSVCASLLVVLTLVRAVDLIGDVACAGLSLSGIRDAAVSNLQQVCSSIWGFSAC